MIGVCRRDRRQERRIIMENVAEKIFYIGYNQHIAVDADALIVSAWNAYVGGEEGKENFISLNNKEYFENSFENKYDAAWAVSMSNKWDWRDEFVFIDEEGYLVSFSRWDDENSPINIDKLDICQLIDELGRLKKKQKKEQEEDNNISRVIHEALE